MLGYNRSGRDYTDYVLGPFDTTGYPYIMITFALFLGGRNDNFQRSGFVPYSNIQATIT
jgi:hypothetical protein